MADETDARDGKAKRTPGWGVGFFVAALVFYFVVDESDPEAVANLPAVISFVVLVVGKAGLIGGSVALGVGLTVWEFYTNSRTGRPAKAGAERRLAAGRPLKG